MSKYKYDIENRLINFSVNVILICGNLNGSFASQHLAKQLIRSTTSAALNYGEAQSA
jgi:four helix bundle protein